MAFNETGTFTTSGDFNAAGNWVTAKPTAGQSFIFQNAVGSNAIDANLNQSATTFGEIYFHESWVNQVGGASGSLRVPCAKLIYEAMTSAWIEQNMTDVIVATKNINVNALVLAAHNASAFTRASLSRGYVTIGANATITDLVASPLRDGDLIVDFESGSVVTRGDIRGGTFTNKGLGGTPKLNLGGGTLYNDSGTLNELRITGGRAAFRGGGATVVFLEDGVLDLTEVSGTVTITTVYQYKGRILAPDRLNMGGAGIAVKVMARGPHGHAPGVEYTIG